MDKLNEFREQLKNIEKSRAQQLTELNKRNLEDRTYNPKNYDTDKAMIHENHSKAKAIVREQMEVYRNALRKGLAEQLNAPSDNTPEAESRWRKAIEKVEQATSQKQIDELIALANRWKDSDLARALVYKHAGVKDKEYIHQAVLERDEVIKELYNLEKGYGEYRTNEEKYIQNVELWDNFTSPENVAGADGVPGRVVSIRRNRMRTERKELEE